LLIEYTVILNARGFGGVISLPAYIHNTSIYEEEDDYYEPMMTTAAQTFYYQQYF
jgi:hypothetical protein